MWRGRALAPIPGLPASTASLPFFVLPHTLHMLTRTHKHIHTHSTHAHTHTLELSTLLVAIDFSVLRQRNSAVPTVRSSHVSGTKCPPTHWKPSDGRVTFSGGTCAAVPTSTFEWVGPRASSQLPACPQSLVQPALVCGRGFSHGGLCSEDRLRDVAELVLTTQAT